MFLFKLIKFSKNFLIFVQNFCKYYLNYLENFKKYFGILYKFYNNFLKVVVE